MIGGASLFGGRGKPLHALLGGLVIGVVYNGLALMGISAAGQFIATAIVLLGGGGDRLARPPAGSHRNLVAPSCPRAWWAGGIGLGSLRTMTLVAADLKRFGPDVRGARFPTLVAGPVGMGISLQMIELAIGWQVYALHRSALDLGLIGLAEFVPMFVLALPAGQLADRGPRRPSGGALLLGMPISGGLALVSGSGTSPAYRAVPGARRRRGHAMASAAGRAVDAADARRRRAAPERDDAAHNRQPRPAR